MYILWCSFTLGALTVSRYLVQVVGCHNYMIFTEGNIQQKKDKNSIKFKIVYYIPVFTHVEYSYLHKVYKLFLDVPCFWQR